MGGLRREIRTSSYRIQHRELLREGDAEAVGVARTLHFKWEKGEGRGMLGVAGEGVRGQKYVPHGLRERQKKST